MPTRNVNLTDHFNKFVDRQIKSGRFDNASEVMRAGLRLLEQSADEDNAKLAVLRSMAKQGFDELDRGEGIAMKDSESIADLLARFRKMKSRSKKHG